MFSLIRGALDILYSSMYLMPIVYNITLMNISVYYYIINIL